MKPYRHFEIDFKKMNAYVDGKEVRFSKKEYLKAKEFYARILSLKGLRKELYEQARSQLVFITND